MEKTNKNETGHLQIALARGQKKLADLDPGSPANQRWLLVDVAGQEIALIQNGQTLLVKPVSTARAGINCREDSGGTPCGLHRIAGKIGQEAEFGSIFVGRQPTGETWHPRNGEQVESDLILTRIMTLAGQEEGINRGGKYDSLARYIYIHGTNHEDLIGTPVSHGCIRMTSADIIELFELVTEGDPVVIV